MESSWCGDSLLNHDFCCQCPRRPTQHKLFSHKNSQKRKADQGYGDRNYQFRKLYMITTFSTPRIRHFCVPSLEANATLKTFYDGATSTTSPATHAGHININDFITNYSHLPLLMPSFKLSLDFREFRY